MTQGLRAYTAFLEDLCLDPTSQALVISPLENLPSFSNPQGRAPVLLCTYPHTNTYT